MPKWMARDAQPLGLLIYTVSLSKTLIKEYMVFVLGRTSSNLANKGGRTND